MRINSGILALLSAGIAAALCGCSEAKEDPSNVETPLVSARIEGRVVDANGVGLARMPVEVSIPSRRQVSIGPSREEKAETDQNGKYVIPASVEGDYRIRVNVDTYLGLALPCSPSCTVYVSESSVYRAPDLRFEVAAIGVKLPQGSYPATLSLSSKRRVAQAGEVVGEESEHGYLVIERESTRFLLIPGKYEIQFGSVSRHVEVSSAKAQTIWF